MIPEVFYFAAYVSVLNEKIYDECYFEMMKLLEKEGFSEDVSNELLKILGDDENKISLDNVLSVLKLASYEDKFSAINLGLNVALADDYWSEDEEKFFEKAYIDIDYPKKELDEQLNRKKTNADQKLLEDVESTKKLYGKSFYKLMSKIAPQNLKEQLEQRYKNCLLSGTDYNDAIKIMREISNEDIVFAKTSLERVSSKMTEFLNIFLQAEKRVKSLLEKLHRTTDENQEIEKCFDGIKKQVSDFIKETQNQVMVSLKEKEIAAKYYTISFMGRTKAGKSTLHSVILNGLNKEFIGVGKERTTRYNRIYKWKGIRIIDTPGIGAPGGKSDTEIAKSVVDESDLICYVVTSDSIQETEFSFLKELKNQNKPIIILLNKKENLSHPIHKKKFLEKPLYWYERKDNDALEGHLIRIKEYAEKYYNNTYFDIYPVQLMAAQLSINEKDKEIKDKLYKGSRMQYFLDGLRIQILDNGKIKRSQTMLNRTIYSLGNYKGILGAQIKELTAIKNTLEKQSKTSIEKIKKAGKDIKSSLKKGLESTYNNFIQSDIRTFATEYYDTKHDLLEIKWKKYFKQTGFENRRKDRVEREAENYKTKVEEIVQEFSENLTFAFDNLDVKFDLKSTFDTKKLFAITESLVGFAGSALGATNPIGWVVFGIGAVVRLNSGLFKSKDKKIKEAQDKLYESIKNSFEENMDSSITKVINDFSKATNKTETQIENLFTKLIGELNILITEIKPLKKTCETYEERLNKLYALRVLNFAKGKDIFDINDASLLSHIKVNHDFANKMTIKTDLVKHINTETLKYILQEDIELETL